MTYSEKEMLHLKMGQRLKQLAKEHGLTREDIGEIINYSCGHISRFYNGIIEIPDSAAQILSKLWNIRPEYILCEDDFKTDEEMYLYVNESSIQDMKAAMSYLQTLGIELRPHTILSCPLTELYKHFSQLKDHIKTSEIQRLQDNYNFGLPQKEFFKTYFHEECNIELSSPIPGIPFLCAEDISKTAVQEDTFFISVSDSNNPIGTNCTISLYFKVYYRNKFIRTVSLCDLQEFIKKLDAYSKCTIETILFNKDFGSYFTYTDHPIDSD